MSTVHASPAAARRPLGRRAFAAIVLVGVSALGWGGIAREQTKAVMPDSLLPWVLLAGDDDPLTPALVPAAPEAEPPIDP